MFRKQLKTKDMSCVDMALSSVETFKQMVTISKNNLEET